MLGSCSFACVLVVVVVDVFIGKLFVVVVVASVCCGLLLTMLF